MSANEINPTILYVDDDDNDVLLLKHALRYCKRSLNLQVVNDPEKATAYLGGEGIYADRRLYPFPSLVLLDLKMPRVNGMEVLAWIRSQPEFRCLVVIVFSASNQASEVDQAYCMGANSYLVKPVELELLVGVVKGMTNYWLSLNKQPSDLRSL
jgi:CheY-like chemotaxis protein